MSRPKFNLEKIKYGVDGATFQKAVNLYEKGKVTQFKEGIGSYSATVIGTRLYQVSVEARNYNYSYCECYLGQNDTLCKHIIAIAIYATKNGEKLTEEDKLQITKPTSSRILGELEEVELKKVKKEITYAVSFIKYYSGPSKTWFVYQNFLDEGVNRLSTIINKLPISAQTADLVISTLLRLDRKLQGGVDDSNGTVGGFIEEAVEVLKEYALADKGVIKSFSKLVEISSMFDWEDPLLNLYNRHSLILNNKK